MSEDTRTQETKDDHKQRDSETLRMLGGFLSILACIVLIAAVFQDPGHARVVNATAGIVLFALGAAMFVYGRKLRNSLR